MRATMAADKWPLDFMRTDFSTYNTTVIAPSSTGASPFVLGLPLNVFRDGFFDLLVDGVASKSVKRKL